MWSEGHACLSNAGVGVAALLCMCVRACVRVHPSLFSWDCRAPTPHQTWVLGSTFSNPIIPLLRLGQTEVLAASRLSHGCQEGMGGAAETHADRPAPTPKCPPAHPSLPWGLALILASQGWTWQRSSPFCPSGQALTPAGEAADKPEAPSRTDHSQGREQGKGLQGNCDSKFPGYG